MCRHAWRPGQELTGEARRVQGRGERRARRGQRHGEGNGAARAGLRRRDEERESGDLGEKRRDEAGRVRILG